MADYSTDPAIKQAILEYLDKTYGLSGPEAQTVVDKIGATPNSNPTTWDTLRRDWELDNSLGPTSKDWVDQVTSDLGIAKKGATPAEQATNDQTAAAGQQQATVQQTSQAIQQAAQNPNTTPSDLASLANSLSGAKQPPIVYQTLGRPATDAELQHAITLYNQANPSDHIDPTDTTEFLTRVQYGVPEAMSALGQSVEGVDLGQVHFNVWDPNSKTMQTEKVDRNRTDVVLKQFPDQMSGLGNIVGASHRTNGEVPWGLLVAANKLSSTIPPKGGQFGEVGGHYTLTDALARDVQVYLRKFNDPTLALIALKDPDLAQAIYDNGGSTTDQAQKAQQILLDAGYDPKTMADMGVAVDPKKFAAIVGSGGSGAGATVNLPDPAALRSGATAMYRAWFQREPTESELQQFVGAIDSQVVSTQKAVSNPFKPAPAVGISTQQATDPQSQIEQTLRNSPEYSQLFGQKPIGVSETDYANQFKSAGSRLLGGDIPNPDAVRLGMETGSTEDTLRYLFGQQLTQGNQDQNSTFNQRVAQAAQAIAAVT